MKINLSILCIFLALLIFSGCKNKSTPDSSSFNGLTTSQLTDSLSRLETLITTAKSQDYELALSYANRAFKLANSTKSDSLLAHACFLKGIVFKNHLADSAFLNNNNALDLAVKTGYTTLLPKLLYNQAMYYRNAEDLNNAVVLLDSCIAMATLTGNNEILSNAFNALGNAKYDLQDTADSRKMYNSAYEIAQKSGLPKQMGVAMVSLSRFEKNPSATIQILKNAITILQEHPGYEEEIAAIQINLGNRSLNPDTAIMFLNQALKNAGLTNATELKLAAWNTLAYCYLDKNNPKQATEYLITDAIPLAEKTGNTDWCSSLYDTYKDVLVSEGNYKLALHYEEKAMKVHKEADRQSAHEQTRLLAALLDTRNKEIRISEAEKAIQSKENSIRLMALIILAILFLLIATLLLFVWRSQRSKIKYQSGLLESANRIITIEEKMKGKIAMELHDMVTPFSLTMLQLIEKSQIRDNQLEGELKESLGNMAEKLRTISHYMSNDFINRQNINDLVYGLCMELQTLGSTPIRLERHLENYEPSPGDQLHIYRIIQELLTNGIKYANQGEIRISCSIEDEEFVILYSDDGPGFRTEESQRTGLGISNIYERVRILNGNAVLNSDPLKGTSWNIAIPVKLNQS